MKKFLIILVSILVLGSATFADTFPIDIEDCIIRNGRVRIAGWYNQRRSYGKHKAIDIPAIVGTPVKTFRKGRVIKISHEYWSRNNMHAYGNYIVIEERNGTKWLYAHLNATNVKLNENVKEGEIIGFVGWTGLPYIAPHLHMEKRDKYGKKIMFTKQLGDSVRKYLPNPKTKYTFVLR